MSPTISVMLRDLAAMIALWRARTAQRRALSELDDKALADIGLTRDAARGEALRPFWRGEEQQEGPGRYDRAAAMPQPVFVAFSEKASGKARHGVRQAEQAGALCRLHHREQPVGKQLVLVQPVELQAGLAKRGEDVGERVDPVVAAPMLERRARRPYRSAPRRRGSAHRTASATHSAGRGGPRSPRGRASPDGSRRDRGSRRARAHRQPPAPSGKCREASRSRPR